MSETKTPLVSVVMPVFNAENYLAISVKSVLNQTFQKFEFIIIDDGSKDESLKIARKFAQNDRRVKVIARRVHTGICQSLNAGLRVARGKYLARMDADDFSYPKRLELQYNFLEKHPQAVICGGTIAVCNQNLKVLNTRKYPIQDKEIRQKILRLNPFAHPTIMVRKTALLKAGGYNPKYCPAEDYELYLRLGQFGQFANLNSRLLKLRVHSDSISAGKIRQQAKLNYFLRTKVAVKYDYPPTICDKVYFRFNQIGIYLIPNCLKFRVYNLLRSFLK